MPADQRSSIQRGENHHEERAVGRSGSEWRYQMEWFCIRLTTPESTVMIPVDSGAREGVLRGRIGKTVRIRRGPAAVIGDERCIDHCG